MDKFYSNEAERGVKNAQRLAEAMNKVLRGASTAEAMTAITMLTCAYVRATGHDTREWKEAFIAQFERTLRIGLECEQ